MVIAIEQYSPLSPVISPIGRVQMERLLIWQAPTRHIKQSKLHRYRKRYIDREMSTQYYTQLQLESVGITNSHSNTPAHR